MKTYEIKKIRRNWAVYEDGKFVTWFSTKRVAQKCIEVRKIQDSGENFTPLHPRWAELMTD